MSAAAERECEFEAVVLDDRGNIIGRPMYRVRQLTEDLGSGIVLEMVAIAGGSFFMGSPRGQGQPDEQPYHSVRVKGFYLGKCMVTQEQWRAVMGKSLRCRCTGDKRPVENVSWIAAGDFCRRLSHRSGHRYRLPSEAEWEYACRAGTQTPFSCGPTITTELANYCGDHTFGAEPRGVYRHVTTEVASFPPNPFGLHDMHGNLWEWCADAWHESYDGAPTDGSAWGYHARQADRVVRGGSWHDTPDLCRSSFRTHFDPSTGDDLVGFRVALEPSYA